MVRSTELGKSAGFPTKLVQSWEHDFWFSKTAEVPIVPEQCFVGLDKNMAVGLITRAVLNNVFPGLNHNVGGTRTTVRLVEFHALVVRSNIAMTGQGLGATGPKLTRGMEEGGGRIDTDRIAKGGDVPLHIPVKREVYARGEVGGGEVVDAVFPVRGIDSFCLRL